MPKRNVKAAPTAADTNRMSPVRALPRPGRLLLVLQVAMVVQAAAFAGGLAVSDAGRWQPLAVGSAAGSLVLAWFLGRQSRSAWGMGAGFEALLVALGGAALSAGTELPGAAVSLVLGVVLVLPQVRTLFAEQAPAPVPVRLTPPAVTPARPVAPSLPPPPAFPPPAPTAPTAPTASTASTALPSTLRSTPLSAPPPPPPGWHPRTV